MQISLIVATYGRSRELESLLESFVQQNCDLSIFEVIIVDQNDLINLDLIVAKYTDELNIVHYKTTVKGLSKSKNKGIELAKGSIVTFPDDDSTFYPDTISNALNYLHLNPDVDVVYGRIFDRETNQGVMRNWSAEEKELSLMNFSLNYSAITCFSRLKILFDVNYGVGSKISSGEELDYIIRAINDKNIVKYTPVIEVWHPELNVKSMSLEKVYNYGYGYGAIMRKNCNLVIFLIFMLSLGYQVMRLILNVFSKNSANYIQTIKGRVQGFLKLQ